MPNLWWSMLWSSLRRQWNSYATIKVCSMVLHRISQVRRIFGWHKYNNPKRYVACFKFSQSLTCGPKALENSEARNAALLEEIAQVCFGFSYSFSFSFSFFPLFFLIFLQDLSKLNMYFSFSRSCSVGSENVVCWWVLTLLESPYLVSSSKNIR